jgi:NAD(P)-dependent dehydrogenase (short-subunit alcohol dehydrogenase family)
MLPSNAVWFITGCSKGFGKAIAKQALTSGYRVVATARKTEELKDISDAFPETSLVLKLDVTDPRQIISTIQSAQDRFGRVDVLVNNAGYGYLAAIEEGEDEDVRELFETNVFAPVNLIKAVLSGMRERGAGYIINFSSVGGFVTFPAVGYYHMSKFAIEGLSETLAKEVNPLGIGVMVVEPGTFRTGFRSPSSIKQSKLQLDAYKDTAGKARNGTLEGDGKQSGDPERGARVLLEALESNHTPLHLVLGGDALGLVRQKVVELQREWDAWEAATKSTDIPK